jgi:ubiquinol-cytochrome c reductase cytochrome b subunit
MANLFSNVYDWLDERTGIKEITSELLDEPIKGGARWAYVFGSALLFIFSIQVVTGIFLTMYYVPSADHAHTSVAYIQKVVPGGWLLRGLHHYGSSLMVIMVVAHLAQTFLYGAYKGKREILWMAGVAMMLIVLAFGFTGYLLTWDQAAYFGTKVGTSIAGEPPVVGAIQQRIMQGGTDLTTLTLSRFFMTHVFLLPLGLAGLAGLHLFLFRKATPAGPYQDNPKRKTERFYPGQLFKDSVAMAIVFAVLVLLSWKLPAELGPMADPSSDYLARPPWYFMPLFQLLKYFPGQLMIIPAFILPTVLFGALFLLPFYDKKPERNPFKRPIATSLLVLVIGGTIGLMALAKYQDNHDPAVKAKLEAQEKEMHEFFAKPFEQQVIGGTGAAAGGALAKVAEPPAAYVENCASCHGDHGEGAAIFPALVGVSAKPQRTQEDLYKILVDATPYGLKPPMPPSFKNISDEDKKKIAEWLASLKK